MEDATSRRSEREVLEFDGLRIETNARRVSVDGVEVALTKTEFDLLVLLAVHARNLVTSVRIFESVWGTDWVGDGHAVEVQISRLRRKLGDSANSPRFISTVRGLGYRFDAVPRDSVAVVTYDDQLRIIDIEPRDRPFLGWDPHDLIGTDGTRGLQLVVTDCSVAWNPSTGACGGTTTQLLSAPLASLGSDTAFSGITGLAENGGPLRLQFSLTLPNTANNETTVNGALPANTIQGLAAALTWTISETQRDATTSNA